MSPDGLLDFGFSNWLAVIILAAAPISELRGAIPLAIFQFNYPWYYAFLLAVIGNLLPVPFILLFLNAATRLVSKVSLFKRILDWLFDRIRRRGRIVERYEWIGLVLLVAIPLPFTGAWTGSIAAALLGLKFRHSLLSIFVGILIAGVIVTLLAEIFRYAIFP